MSRPKKFHPTPGRVITFHFVYVLIAFSLIALACSTITQIIDDPAFDSPVPGPGPSGIGGPTRPVGFVNHGSFIAVVMPWTFIPLGSDSPATPPDVSTISSVPTSPGLWPNPSRFLSLPFGSYTWCFAWDEGDLDSDGYVDYFHFFDTRQVTVDENAPDNPDLAIQVDFSAPPEGSEILSGQCGDDPVAATGSDAPMSPVDDYPHIYKGKLKLDTALGTCNRIDYFNFHDPPPAIKTEENKVVLTVDEHGNINGKLKARRTATHQGQSAGTINAEEFIGDCEGAITETDGNLKCSLTQQFFVYCSDCGTLGFPKNNFEVSFDIYITIGAS